ncbi:MAG: EamA family transporter RarD [Oligoflexales bacterium]|nr:EamA family transporter RarD [Oligoflexales bacterium]
MRNDKLGLTTGVISYLLWGFLPLYWKLLADFDSDEILCHRCLWGLVLIMGFYLWRNPIEKIALFKSIEKKYWLAIIAGTCCISLNWLINVKAVNSGNVVESSLGYYINPIFSVLLGTVVFKERLNYNQWLAVLVASFGVILLFYFQGEVPWISLSITLTFGCYGLFKKLSPLETSQRMFIELSLLSVFIIPILCYREYTNHYNFSSYTMHVKLLFVGAGLATIVPLLCFGHAIINLNLTTLGFLQYIAPTLQFLMGILVFDETLDFGYFVAFGFIWAAIIIYTIDKLRSFAKEEVSELVSVTVETG